MAFVPQTRVWPEDRAILFVHGVGDYKPGGYERVQRAFEAAIGTREWNRYAVYEMYWDPISDAIRNKLRADGLFDRLLACLKGLFPASDLGAVMAEGAGDVIWPVLHAEGREALRRAHIRQIQQIVKDGRAKRVARRNMKLVTVAHSLGCFHTYEAFSEAATDDSSAIHPSSGVQMDAWILMASPVQLIRSVALAIKDGVPSPNRLHCLKGDHLRLPGYTMRNGRFIPYARRVLCVAGDLDPVGGYLFHERLGWAYMDLAGTDRVVERQQIASIQAGADLAALVRAALAGGKPWVAEPNNPHDWVTYVEHHADRIREWLLS